MSKNALFQDHWFVGVTAGVVLAIVGITGALLSFEGDLQAWFNRDVHNVEDRNIVRLMSAMLAAHVQNMLDHKIVAVTVSSLPTESARRGRNGGRATAKAGLAELQPQIRRPLHYTAQLLSRDSRSLAPVTCSASCWR